MLNCTQFNFIPIFMTRLMLWKMVICIPIYYLFLHTNLLPVLVRPPPPSLQMIIQYYSFLWCLQDFLPLHFPPVGGDSVWIAMTGEVMISFIDLLYMSSNFVKQWVKLQITLWKCYLLFQILLMTLIQDTMHWASE